MFLGGVVCVSFGWPKKSIQKPLQSRLSFRTELMKEHIHNGETFTVSDDADLLLTALEQLQNRLDEMERTRPKGLFEPRFYADGWKIKRLP